MTRALLVITVLGLGATSHATWETVATPFAVAGERPELTAAVDLRVRERLTSNLDLDRGPTPSGDLLYPAPGSDPTGGQLLMGADLRLRLEPLLLYKGIALRARIDLLDNVALGSTPVAAPSQSVVTGQDIARYGLNSLADAVAIRQLWGEVALPVGMLAVGRMGNQWGLGLVANDGRCADCDGGDSADRVAFVTPLVGHLFGVGFDWSSSGPQLWRDHRALDRDPADDVRSLSAMALNYLAPAAVERKVRAGKWVLNYGVLGSYRWQGKEAVLSPDASLTAPPVLWVERGLSTWIVDGWLRFNWRGLRIEAEVAYLDATVANASLVPGLLLKQPLRAQQWGGALEAEWVDTSGLWSAGCDLGVASGDPAPALGGRESARFGAPGDLDGTQIRPPYDLRIDNFRFHRNYRVDRILWRELVGTVTDGAYLRPRAALGPWHGLSLELALVGSTALYAESAPGRANLLGVELDPTLRYRSTDGFELALDYGVLFPLPGLASGEHGGGATPGQLLQGSVRFLF